MHGTILGLFVLHTDYIVDEENDSFPMKITKDGYKKIMFSPDVNTHEINISELQRSTDFITITKGSKNKQSPTAVNPLGIQPFLGIPFEVQDDNDNLKQTGVYTTDLVSTAFIKKPSTNNNYQRLLLHNKRGCTLSDYRKYLLDEDEDLSDKDETEIFTQWMKELGNFDLKTQDNLIAFSERFKLDYCPKHRRKSGTKPKFVSTKIYAEIKELFQKKYNTYLAFLDGNHRAYLFSCLLNEIEINDELKNVKRDVYQMNHGNTLLHNQYNVHFYLPKMPNRFPELEYCRSISQEIKDSQSNTFHQEFKDTVQKLCAIVEEIQTSDEDIKRLVKSHWLGKQETFLKVFREKIFPRMFEYMNGRKMYTRGKFAILNPNKLKDLANSHTLKGKISKRGFISSQSAGSKEGDFSFKVYIELLKFCCYDESLKMKLMLLMSNRTKTYEVGQEGMGNHWNLKFDTNMDMRKILSVVYHTASYYLQYVEWYYQKIKNKKSVTIHHGSFEFRVRLMLLKDIVETMLLIGSNPTLDPQIMTNNGFSELRDKFFESKSDGSGSIYQKIKVEKPKHAKMILILKDYEEHVQAMITFLKNGEKFVNMGLIQTKLVPKTTMNIDKIPLEYFALKCVKDEYEDKEVLIPIDFRSYMRLVLGTSINNKEIKDVFVVSRTQHNKKTGLHNVCQLLFVTSDFERRKVIHIEKPPKQGQTDGKFINHD